MTEVKNARKAEARVDDLFINRWSPRAFSDKAVPPEILKSLFEAARWAPSCFNEQPWLFLYDRGNVPGLVIGCFGLFLLIAGFFWKKLGSHRRVGVFLVLFLIIGPGLIVNAIFKGHWGRPRPVEIVDFGGEQVYRPVWQKGIAGQGKSFPSGHASIGYYLMGPFFFLYPMGRKRWGLLFLMIGLAYGTTMGIGRIVQGAHFASDVLWSAGFVYYTGLVLSIFFRFDRMGRKTGQL